MHRVVTNGNCDRYSIACFYEPNFEAVVKCLPTCSGPDNPPKYSPISCFPLLHHARSRFLQALLKLAARLRRYPDIKSGDYTLYRYAESQPSYDVHAKANGAAANGHA